MKFPKNLDSEFVVITPDKQAVIERCDAKIYTRLDQNYDNFAGHELISSYEFQSDWSGWEMHPQGDEVVVLLTGAVTFLFEGSDGQTAVHLTEQGQYLVVPKGTWHTAKTQVKSKLLFITPGEGTQHKPV